MGLMDFIKGELIDLIEWTDDSRDTLSYRFPDGDKAIKNGAQLIVRESQGFNNYLLPGSYWQAKYLPERRSTTAAMAVMLKAPSISDANGELESTTR
jgi:hypothetical protein